MTIQEQIKANLAKSGIAHKEIKCYGSQIMITTRGKASAEKFATLVGKFATEPSLRWLWSTATDAGVPTTPMSGACQS